MSTNIKHYVECQCDSGDHVIRFVYSPADDKTNFPPDLYMEVQMCQPNGFFRRLWLAVKYLFKKECEYGHWDCTLIAVDEVIKLQKLLEQFEKDCTDYRANKATK